MVKVLHNFDRVLMEIDHPELWQVVQTLDLPDTVGLQPKGLNVLVRVQVLNFGESFVMQVEGVVQRWLRVLTVLLAQLFKVSLSDVRPTIFVLV